MTPREKVNNQITKRYKKYLSYSRHLCAQNKVYDVKPYFEDVLHEVLAEILEFNEKRLERVCNYVDQYVYQMLKINIKSTTGKYHRKYNKPFGFYKLYFDEIPWQDLENIEAGFNIIVDEEVENDRIIYTTFDNKKGSFNTYQLNYQDIETVLRKCPFYDSEIFLKKVYKYKTFKDFSEDTGIPPSSLFRTFNNIRNKIKKELK